MQIISLSYMAFFLCVLIVYYLAPKKIRWIVLLLASVAFYLLAGLAYAKFLGITILSTYLIALGIGKTHNDQKKKLEGEGLSREDKKRIKARQKRIRRYLVVLNLLINLGLLSFLKYFNFFSASAVKLLSIFHLDAQPIRLNLILPLGISFYTFQTVGYIIDVYRGKYEPEKNPAKFALFASFFPQIIQGPIGRYDVLAPMLFEKKRLDYKQVCNGMQLALWGLFKKLVIADRLNIVVNQVYNNPESYGGVPFIIATALFSIQIYADFSGCIDIVSGVAESFGIKLSPNFDRPYFSKTMPEFWRRWHITLGTWFKDYLFYPISVSKFVQNINKSARKRFGNNAGRILSGIIPVFFVWMATGLWHGAEWKYVFWGLFHGGLIMLGIIFAPLSETVFEKLHLPRKSFPFRLYQMVRTFLLCCLGRVFFRSPSMSVAIGVFKKIFTNVEFKNFFQGQTYLDLGLDVQDWYVAVVAVLILWIASLVQGRWKVRDWIGNRLLVVRWVILYVAIFVIIVFGVYGPGFDASAFIYNEF